MKMADKIGGLEDTIDDLAESLSLAEYDVMDYPAPRSIPEMLEDAAKGFGLKGPRVASRSCRSWPRHARSSGSVAGRRWPRR
jgi:hypothetical protein